MLKRFVREDPIDATTGARRRHRRGRRRRPLSRGEEHAAVPPRGRALAAARCGSASRSRRTPAAASSQDAAEHARGAAGARTRCQPLADDVVAEIDASSSATRAAWARRRRACAGARRRERTRLILIARTRGPGGRAPPGRRLRAGGLRPRRRADRGGVGRLRRRTSRRRHRPRAQSGSGHGQLDRRGRRSTGAAASPPPVRRAGARSAGARHAPALGDGPSAGVLPRARVTSPWPRATSATSSWAGVWTATQFGHGCEPQALTKRSTTADRRTGR